jgi:hypothetical protein
VERYWTIRARRLQLRVNLGWWLHAFIPIASAIAVAGTALILIARRTELDVALPLAVSFSIGAIVALVLAKRRFFSLSDAFARLDLSLGLFNRLSSAAEGVGPWPAKDARSDRIRWRANLSAVLLPPALLAGAWWVPISTTAQRGPLPTSQPIAWTEMEEVLSQLEHQDSAVEKESIEEWRERVAKLRKQPEEKWFEHASLEASDHLREQLDRATSKLEQDLLQAGDALDRSDDQAWKQALQDLQLGKLKVDPKTLDRAAIVKGLKQVKLARGEDPGKEIDLLVIAKGEGAGRGGVDRGRADAELTLRPDPTDASTGEQHNLATGDRTRAALGDLMGTSEKEHEIDPSRYRGPTSGGTIGNSGGGGEAVWKSSLPPDEQDFLERYFR